MADVIQKAISANNIVQGAAVVAVNEMGSYQNVDPQNTDAVDTDLIESKYTGRFN